MVTIKANRHGNRARLSDVGLSGRNEEPAMVSKMETLATVTLIGAIAVVSFAALIQAVA